MHPNILNNRMQDAQDRILSAVEALSKSLNLPDDVTANLSYQYRNKEVERLTRLEAVADVVEAMAEGYREKQSELRAAKREAKLANEEADAIQAQKADADKLRDEIKQLKAELKAAKTVPSPAQAQTQEAVPFQSPASPEKAGKAE